MMNRVLFSATLIVLSGVSFAKLPPLDDAAKAKAAEAAAKAAWQTKVDSYLLCKVQDKIAASYKKSGAATAAATTNATPTPTSTAAAPPAAATPPAVATPPAAAASGTPVAASPPTPCTDPGPFAYNPPEQKPLETSGAHSPAGNATSPPSVKPNSAEMAPAKK